MFQYVMNDIVREYLDIICVGIVDDVIVFSITLEEHVVHVRKIVEVLRQHKLYAKIEKLTFLGFWSPSLGSGWTRPRWQPFSSGLPPRL